jgi:RNA 2',3'-cyclic 3'-phosphodiesterase
MNRHPSAIPAHRLFLAIPIPDDVRAELRQLQLRLQPLLPSHAVRWTKPEQFHLTLKFLGSVPVADTEALSRAVRVVCEAATAMRLRAEDVGFFPHARSPRVFWVDIKSVDGLLVEFQQRLELAVQPFAEKQEDKKFTAHISLARFEKVLSSDMEKLRSAIAVDGTFGEWTAKEVQLMKSSLQPAGAIHAIMDMFKTKNS